MPMATGQMAAPVAIAATFGGAADQFDSDREDVFTRGGASRQPPPRIGAVRSRRPRATNSLAWERPCADDGQVSVWGVVLCDCLEAGLASPSPCPVIRDEGWMHPAPRA
jgi:hypothetical protein